MEALDPRVVEILERNLESIVLLAKPRGIEPVLVTFASQLPADDDPEALAKVGRIEQLILTHRFTPAGLFQAVKAVNDGVRRVADRNGVLLVDLANTLPREGVFGDFAHKTDEGLEVFADLMFQVMIEDGVIDRVLARRQHAAATGATPSS